MKLNERLTAVASFVDEGSQLLDVGCDHAFLDIYLVERNLVKRAVASDIHEGPLEHALKNITEAGLLEKIEIRLGNGIETLDEKIDAVVISGMGGLTMLGILKYEIGSWKNVKALILSPNNDAYRLRKELVKLGYEIIDEELVQDRNFFYPILKLRKGKKKYSEMELVYGPVLLEKKGQFFLQYIENEKKLKQQILNTLPKKYFQRRWQLKKELRILKKIN